jgi:hypothetical protein
MASSDLCVELAALTAEQLVRVAAPLASHSAHRAAVQSALLSRVALLPRDDASLVARLVALLAAHVAPPAPHLLRAALAAVHADPLRAVPLFALLAAWLDGDSAEQLSAVVAALTDAVAADRSTLLPALAALADLQSAAARDALLRLALDALPVVADSDVPVVVRALLRAVLRAGSSPAAARAAFDRLRSCTGDLGASSFRLTAEALGAALASASAGAALDAFLGSVADADELSALDCAVLLWLMSVFDASFVARGAERWIALRNAVVGAAVARRLALDTIAAACQNHELFVGRTSALCALACALLQQDDWYSHRLAAHVCVAMLDAFDNAAECVGCVLECTADERAPVAARSARFLRELARARPLRMARSVAQLEEALLQTTRADAAIVTPLTATLVAAHSAGGGASAAAAAIAPSLMLFVQKQLFSAAANHVCVGTYAARALLLAAAPSAEESETLIAWLLRALHESEFCGASATALLDSFSLLSPRLEAQRRSVLFHASLLPFLSQVGLVHGAPRPPRFFGGSDDAASDSYFLLSALVGARAQSSPLPAVGAAVRCVVQFYGDMYGVANGATIWRVFGARMQLPESYGLDDAGAAGSQRHAPLLLLSECRSIVYALEAYEALLSAVWGGRDAAPEPSGSTELLACIARLLLFRRRAAQYATQLAAQSAVALVEAAREVQWALTQNSKALCSIRALRALSRGLLALLSDGDGGDQELTLDVLRLVHAGDLQRDLSESDAEGDVDAWLHVAGFVALCPPLARGLVSGCARFSALIVALRSTSDVDEKALDRALALCALCLALLERVLQAVSAANEGENALVHATAAAVRIRDGRSACLRHLTAGVASGGGAAADDFDSQHRDLFRFLTGLFGVIPERFLALMCLRALMALTEGLEASCLVAQHFHAALALVYPLERLAVLQALGGDGDALVASLPRLDRRRGESDASVRFKATSLAVARQAFVSFCLQAVFRLLPPHRLQACAIDDAAATSSGFGSALMTYADATNDVTRAMVLSAAASAKSTAAKTRKKQKKRCGDPATTPGAGAVEHATIHQLSASTVRSFFDALSAVALGLVMQFDPAKTLVLHVDDATEPAACNAFAPLIQALRAYGVLLDAHSVRTGQSAARDRVVLNRVCRLVPHVVRRVRACFQWRTTCGTPAFIDVSRAPLLTLVQTVRSFAVVCGALVRVAKEQKHKSVAPIVPRATALLEQLRSECDRWAAAEHLDSVRGNGAPVGALAPGEWAGVSSNVCDALVRDAQMAHIFAAADDADADADDAVGGILRPEDAARFRVTRTRGDGDDGDDDDGDSGGDEDEDEDELAPVVVTFRE